MTLGFERRAIPRWAAQPASTFDDAGRRAALSQVAREVHDLAGRVVDELLAEAENANFTLEERRGLVAIALQVDRQAAVRTGTPARTVEIAARGRAALNGGVEV